MAGAEESWSSGSFSMNSYDTALCVILPPTHCSHVDRLRELYDKAYGKWPPHINLIYPFVAPECLPRAQERIQKQLRERLHSTEYTVVDLHNAGHFKQRNNSTIFLHEGQSPNGAQLEWIRYLVLQALNQTSAHTSPNLHLTIGQSADDTESSREFLLAKARLIPALQFIVGALAILIRERAPGTDSAQQMMLWGIVDIDILGDVWQPQTPEYWLSPSISESSLIELDEYDNDEFTSSNREVQTGTTFCFDIQQNKWLACTGNISIQDKPGNITVSSYNVLVDSEHPPGGDRDSLLVATLLSDSAATDVLVLQEVSDGFLSYILSDAEVQRRYPFTSHAPPSQPDVGPLPSLRNIIVLSRLPFSWKWVPFHRRHKGALVACFKDIAHSSVSDSRDLIVAGIHLTCGLTDGSVAANKNQLNNLTNYLAQHHHGQPWIIAGDFNLTTSTYTINTALTNKYISTQTTVTLASMERALSDLGLLDAWAVARIEAADDLSGDAVEALYHGEEGATFDLRNNSLAPATSGTSNNRPQRYDRILARPQNMLQNVHFNRFGFPQEIDGVPVVASDHLGVRVTMKLLDGIIDKNELESDMMRTFNMQCKRATEDMADISSLSAALSIHRLFMSEEEVQHRRQAFQVLKQVILGTSNDDDSGLPEIPMVLVAVGSYALGVDTLESDIDCLCIGAISSKTFFKLARQRLVKAESRGIRILRKVEANTGTMLELSINGIAMDLQYCPAARVVERWAEFRNIPASDPIFNLSVLSLRKLKPYRDLMYIQRTLPSIPVFRMAYQCIKLWAIQKGIYASRFGYLSGIHITIMLACIYKRVAHDAGSVSVTDLVTSFFHHYANFDWATDMVYDAFFHKNKPRYHRSAREPMVILGYHTPNSNIAHTATIPGLRTLIMEFKTAEQQLQAPGMTWERFFGSFNASLVNRSLVPEISKFLTTHHSFAKIDIQFWGRTLAKGKGLVGWVESRCLVLVVDINRTLPELEVRIWPARFTDNDPNDNSETNEYHGCYLIGLSRASHARPLSDRDDRLLAKQSLDKVLDRFLTQLKTDSKNYDPDTCWIGVSLAKPIEVQRLWLDNREWGDYVAEMEPDSDEEDILDDLEMLDQAPVQRTLPQRPKPTLTPLSTSKLRPASDVLNRLRWDPSLDPSEYIIGYEDRFLGARETGLEKWKTEQTDEEFIPQHRILYFKKRGGDDGKGEVVWERATRIDKVFGSGAGAGSDHNLE